MCDVTPLIRVPPAVGDVGCDGSNFPADPVLDVEFPTQVFRAALLEKCDGDPAGRGFHRNGKLGWRK